MASDRDPLSNRYARARVLRSATWLMKQVAMADCDDYWKLK